MRAYMIVATLTLAGSWAVSCGSPSSSPPPPDPTPSASTSPGVKSATVDVYYVVDTRAGLRLARERHDVAKDAAVKGAIEAMIAGADDPDYSTSWNPDTRVVAVERKGTDVIVDLSEDARRANVGSAGAALMIQQLVYTATSAAHGADQVTLMIDGSLAGELWGAVEWSGPLKRDSPLEVRQVVQIDSPRDQAVVASPVAIVGEAAVFEATLPWRVVDRSGRTVKSGVAMTTQGQRFAPFRFAVALAPGAYTVEITEDDPSGGAAKPLMTDTRAIVVRD